MKAGRFSESQIVAILKQQDSGQTVAQIILRPCNRTTSLNNEIVS